MGILNDLGFNENRLTEIVRIHNESMDWMYKNKEKLQESYSYQFIGILKNQVVANAPDRKSLLDILEEKYTTQEIEEIFIDYINPKGYVLIL